MTFNLTTDGLAVLYRALTGDTINFTKAKFGNGEAQPLDQIKDLSNPLVDVSFDSIEKKSGNVTLSATFKNSSVDSGFRMTEVGIFCSDPDDDSKEILYAYAREPEASANWIAAADSEIQETRFDFIVFVATAENISAQINESLVYVSREEFNAHTKNNDNPHNVTKTQVGLGNVPNLATNDLTPTYEAAIENTELTSGEKLSVAFGKIARIIKSAISHFSNKENPHGVTAAQVGAAKESHKHSTSDINSGTLSVARGGTGKGTWDKNKLLYAANTTTLSQLDFPPDSKRVLRQGTSGAPFWGLASASEPYAYTGSGVSGEEKANSIRFSTLPNFVFIADCFNPGRYGFLFPGSSHGQVCIDGVWDLLNVSYTTDTDGFVTVEWYYDQVNSPDKQLNSGFYDCVAFW